MSKDIKPLIHIYVPEASSLNVCEVWYLKHTFQRHISKAILKYYSNPEKKNFKKAYVTKKKHLDSKEKGRKGDTSSSNDLFFIISDTDLKPGRANAHEVCTEFRTYYNDFEGEIPIVFSSRSFETWLCMYEEIYTKPFSTSKELEKDVDDNYVKKEMWYKKKSLIFYNDYSNAIKNCQKSRELVIDAASSEHTEADYFKEYIPDLSNDYTINWFLKISTISYMDQLLLSLTKYM